MTLKKIKILLLLYVNTLVGLQSEKIDFLKASLIGKQIIPARVQTSQAGLCDLHMLLLPCWAVKLISM